MSRRTLLAGLVALVVSLVSLIASKSMAVDYTWDGTGDGFTWTDPLNWNLDSGAPTTTADRAFFTTAANVTAGLPQTINRMITGTGLVTLGGSINFGPNVDPNGITVGTGGLVINGNVGNQTRGFTSAGNVTINGTLTMFANFPTQTAGTWDITQLVLPNNAVSIANWNFVDGANTTITNSFTSATYTWTGQPTFAGGRPNWIFNSGGDVGTFLALGSRTLYGNQLSLGSWPGAGTRHTELNSNGGTLDLNVLNVLADSGGTGNFINVDNGTIVINGTSGVVWNNQSDENVQFDVQTNTNTRIDPTGTSNTVSVDTGSVNSGIGGFTNNFAFHNLTLGAGDTVNLTGTAYTGGGNTALYVNNTLHMEDNATLGLAGRNVYVNGALEIGTSPGQATITNGEVHLTSNASMTFELNGPIAGANYDQLVLTGAGSILHLNSADLIIDLGGAGSGLYFLVDNQGTQAIDGIFDGLAQGAQLSFNNGRIIGTLSYEGDITTNSLTGGNDIVLQLVAVPEPSSLLIGSALFGIVLPLASRRRRR